MSFSDWSNEKKKKQSQGQTAETQTARQQTTGVTAGSADTFTQWSNRKKNGTTITGYNDKEAISGWNAYQAAKNAREQQKEDKTWFEKLAGYLGGVSDTTMPTAEMSRVTESYREDTTYREPRKDWTLQQMKEFGFLYQRNPQEAWEYAEQLNNSIDAAQNEEQREQIRQDATGSAMGGALHTAGALLTAPLGLADYLNEIAEYSARGKVTEHGGLTPAEYSQEVTGGVAEHLNEQHGTLDERIPVIGGKGWGDVYGLATSIMQSSLAGKTGGQLGTLVQFFGSAAASGVQEAKNRGASDEQALLLGTLQGLAEGLAEQAGIDNLMKVGASHTWKEFAVNLLKQGGAEGLEEGLTTLMNNISEQIVMQGDSVFYTLVDNYIADGMDPEEAKKHAWLDMVNDIAFDMLGGFISGAVHAGPQTAAETYRTGREMRTTYGEYQQELVEEGMESAEGTDTRKVAERLQDKLNAGRDLSGSDLYRIVDANTQTAAAERLTEMGETGDIQALSRAIAARTVGRELTGKERRMIARSQNAQTVLREFETGRVAEQAAEAPMEAQKPEKEVPVQTVVREEQPVQEATAEPVKEPAATVRENRTVSKPETAPASGQQVTGKLTAEDSTEVQAEQTIEQASRAYGAQAGAMLHTYHQGQDVAKYDQAYRAAFDMGRSGVSLNYVKSSPMTAYLTDGQKELAHKAGAAAAKAEAGEQESKNKASANGKTGHREGTVKGDGVTVKDLTDAFNDTQGMAYRYLADIAKVTGIDIVLYRSESGEAWGKYDWEDPGTIYIDLNSGVRDVKDVNQLHRYMMLRTFSHEFTHFIEKWNPVQYNEFRKVVFDTMESRGEDVNRLIELKQTEGMGYEEASREVVAEAMTDILPDSSFAQTLAEKNRSIFQWFLDKLTEFVDNLKTYFRTIRGGEDAGARALKQQVGDTVKYLDEIVQMYDRIAVEAVEAYQQTVAEEVAVSETENTTETKPAETETEDTVGGMKVSGKTAGVWFDAGGGNVRAFDEADTSGLSETALAGARTAKVLQKLGIGRNYYFYESYVNSNGDRVYKDAHGVERIAPNGWYDPDGSIHIDLNAGAEGKGLTMYTLSHELTHFVEKWSPKKYQTLADFLVSNYAKAGNVDAMVAEKQAELSTGRGSEVSYEEAYSEFIADSMEAMLSDGNVLEKLQELKKTDKSLFDKIRQFFDNLGKKIREIYKDLTPDSLEGQAVLQMKDQIEQIQQLFAEGLVEAGENFQAVAEIGLEVDMETESVSPAVLYSERTWKESDYVQERNKAAQEISKAIGVSVKKARQYIDSVNGIAKMIAEDRTRLDYFSSPGRSSFIGNVEYGGSFDFSTLCKKRRLLTGTFTAIQKALPNTALTANEILDIRNRMKDAKLEVSCGLCYVEGSRANMGQFVKEFLKLYKQYYPDAWQPNMADVNTPDGIEWVRINHPECYEQYEYFWNHYGTLKAGDKNLFASQQKPKLYQLHTEYKGEILQKFNGDDDVEEKNLNGGIRLQSFSDFEIVHLIDTMQIIMDMSRVGLAGQAYTKVPDFAWALGDTGLKINLSLIAKDVDADGKLIFDDVEGMPIAEAMRLRERYSANVGTILVAFNDAQLMAAMADDRVDFIIPFHRSQWKKSQYEAMGLPAKTKDYTYMQNEKFIKPQYHEYRGRMVQDKATNYMPNEYWDFSKSGKENAEAYLQMCARNNKRPKFYKLLQNNGDGSYSLKADGSTDGYWKLLIDFKMYDNDGNGSPQAPVRPEFNMEESARMMREYKGGHSSFPVAQGIVDAFVQEYKQEHPGRQFSDRKQANRTGENAPTFYSYMGLVVDSMKQEKFGAASVVNMLRGKGVKAEEIKWSGIEAWLEGKKSVTKTELQEFIAGSMLQIEEDLLTDAEIPYTQEQLDIISGYEKERDIIAEELKEEWKRIVGEDIPITHFGAGLESVVVQHLLEVNAAKRGNTAEGKSYKAARAAMQKVIENGDHFFGFDNGRQALREILRNPSDFLRAYELTPDEEEAIHNVIKTKEAFSKVDGIPLQDQQFLKEIAERADAISRKIGRVKSDHYAEAAKHKTKYGSYILRGGSNYRELLFRLPGATYHNNSMNIHWDRSGVLAHARIQDLNTFLGKMLFIEEIQSDWHNEGHKSGYRISPDQVTVENTSVKLIDGRYTLHYNGNPLGQSVSATFADRRGFTEARIHEGLVHDFNKDAEWDTKVPDAPFRNTYHEFVLKRLIREAAENGYDSIGWTTADIQSERWSEEYAEGYRIEYDQDIPKFMSKYGKKWGTRVGKTLLDNGTEVWSMAITDSMKDSVLYEGQVLYQDRATGTSNRALLAGAFEELVTSPDELKFIRDYQENISLLNEQEQKPSEALTDRDVLMMAAEELDTGDWTAAERDALDVFQKRLSKLEDLQRQRAEQGKLYREQRFGPNVNRAEAEKTRNRMQELDRQIRQAGNDVLDIEDKGVLKQVLQKARKVVETEERKRGDKKLSRWRDRRNNAEAIKKYRERISKDVKALTDWVIHPDNKSAVKHIPDAVKTTVIPFLRSIDFTSKRQLKGGEATQADKTFMERLRKLEAAMANSEGAEDIYAGFTDLPPDFMEKLHGFVSDAGALVESSTGSEFVINQMTAKELKDLSDIVRALKMHITNMNKFHVNAMFKHVYDAGDNSIDFLSGMKPAKHTGGIGQYVLWQQMRPAYAFERFGKGGEAIYDGLRRGQATLAFNTRKIQEFAQKAYTAGEVKAWEKQLKTIKLASGEKITMKVSQIMSLYELYKRDQAKGHILGDGIRAATFKDAKGKKLSDTGHLLTPEDLNAMFSTLSNRQIEVADKLQKYMQETGGAWGNEVTMARFGEKQFGEENYFPINSDGRHLDVTAEENPKSASLYALLNMGFTKQTQEKARNRIVVYSIFDVFANHMASMAQYNAFALPVVDALKWFNYKQTEMTDDGKRRLTGSVRDEMDRVYGTPEESRPGSGKRGYAQNFIINIIKAFNGTEAQGTPYDSLGMQTLHQYNRAQVAYNLRVVVQQPLAITRAAQLIDYGSIMKGLKLKPEIVQKNIAEMRRYSGIAAWKSLGFYDVNISRGLTALIKHDETVMDKVTDFGMDWAEKADEWTWAAIWSACKIEVMTKQKLTPKNEGFYEAVTKLFEDVIYKTQVVDSVLTKNEFMRDKGFFARAVGSFMSEPTTTASMLADAYDKFQMDMQRGMSRQQAWKKNQGNIVRTAYVYGVGAVVLAAVQAVADAFRDDDDYQDLLEKWVEAFGGNLLDEAMPLNKLPIASDIWELAKELLSKMGVDTYGSAPQSVLMQWYDSLVKGVEIIYGKIAGTEDRYTWYGGVYKLLQAASGIFGVPMAAFTRELVTAWNNTVGAMAPSLKVKTYDSGEKNEIKYAWQDGWLTDEEAMQELQDKGVAKDEDEAYWTMRGWETGGSRYDALYDAVLNGGDYASALKEMTDHGYTEKEVRSQLKSQIGQWYQDGEITKQQTISMLNRYIGMDTEDITATVNKWSSKVVTGIAWNDIKDEYLTGRISRQRAIEMYVRYGGYTTEDATWTVKVWDWQDQGYERASRAMVQAYEEQIQSAGIGKKVYYDAYLFYQNSGEEDVAYSKVKACMPYIDSLPLTDEQKTALALSWWAESTVRRYKTW